MAGAQCSSEKVSHASRRWRRGLPRVVITGGGCPAPRAGRGAGRHPALPASLWSYYRSTWTRAPTGEGWTPRDVFRAARGERLPPWPRVLPSLLRPHLPPEAASVCPARVAFPGRSRLGFVPPRSVVTPLPRGLETGRGRGRRPGAVCPESSNSSGKAVLISTPRRGREMRAPRRLFVSHYRTCDLIRRGQLPPPNTRFSRGSWKGEARGHALPVPEALLPVAATPDSAVRSRRARLPR